MPILLGVAAALLIGFSDTFGRASSRRDQASITHVVAQMAVGTCVALPFTLIIDSTFIRADVLSAALSGVFVAVGLAIAYRAMADASSAVTAPLAGVLAIVLPLGWDLLTGARLSGTAAVGCVVAIIALLLVSVDPSLGTERLQRGIGLAFLAGIFFGLTFIFAGSTSEASGAWPAVVNRAVGLVGISVLAIRQHAPLLLDPPVRKFGIGGGVAGALGMLALIAGAQLGDLGTVSVIAGSYPVVIVVLTSLFDDDSIRWWQFVGVIGAILGTTLIALG